MKKTGSHKIVDPGQQHIDEFSYEAPSDVKNVLIVGASGYLGSALCLGLRDQFNVTGTYNERVFRLEGILTCEADALDATDLLNAISKSSPDIVIYCSGVTRLTACEVQYDLAEALNAKLMSILFKVLPKPTPLIYLSCDHVFGERTKPEPVKASAEEGADFGTEKAEAPGIETNHQNFFREHDACNPLNALGQTKLKGEKAVLAQPHLTWVIRLPLLYGE